MNTREATKKEYDGLNNGSEDGEQGLGFADFGLRIQKLWTEGQQSGGTRGIVPIMTGNEAPLAGLDFYLVRPSIKVRFRSWRMEPVASRMHTTLFRGLYGVKAGALNEEPEEDTNEGAEAELTMTLNGEQNATEPSNVLPEVKPPSSGTVVERVEVKRKGTKNKKKSDIFDPLDGLLY